MAITEDYVSFETAKLLKDKGFNEKCNSYFISNNEIALIANKRDFNKHGIYLSAPTLQRAMKWLRIEHNIHIEPHIVKTKCSYGYMPNYVDLKELKPHFPFDEFDFSNADKYVCITYDKACDAAIKYCLENLI